VTTDGPPSQPPDDDPLIGTLIDRRYRVIGRIGDGGMGIVYKVEHTYLNKWFAMKVMRPTRDAIDRARFDQEAQLASKIRHKNVVEISDFGVLPTGQPYFVMEFLRGNTLGDAIYEGRIDTLLACHIAAQVASGLQAVHKQSVVHRDLKPDNIFLIDPDEQEPGASEALESGEWSDVHFVKIMDFGIAKAVDKNLTGTGMTLGTPEYMSPEQATGDKIDWRSDQYSLGCILYEMITGELPFQGKGAFEIMNKHLTEAPKPPRQRRPELANTIPPALEKIVLTMMAKKVSGRFQSMRLVEQGLREVVAAMRVASGASAAPTMVSIPNAVKTVIAKPSDTGPTLLGSPPQGMQGATLPVGQSQDPGRSDAATRPMLQAIPRADLDAALAPTPFPPPSALTDPPAPPPAGSQNKTVMMPPRPGAAPPQHPGLPAGLGADRGHTPTPKLIDKLTFRVKGSSVPELPPAPWWQHYRPLRWLAGILYRLSQRLRGK